MHTFDILLQQIGLFIIYILAGLAASVLSQASSGKMTGKHMEEIASAVLKSNKYSDVTKSLAGSVLSQSDKRR